MAGHFAEDLGLEAVFSACKNERALDDRVQLLNAEDFVEIREEFAGQFFRERKWRRYPKDPRPVFPRKIVERVHEADAVSRDAAANLLSRNLRGRGFASGYFAFRQNIVSRIIGKRRGKVRVPRLNQRVIPNGQAREDDPF